MARARNIKPSFFKNELLVEMGPFDRLLFIGLWCLADREGRVEDRPKRIKMELLPCDAYDVDAGLVELARYGFIKRYEAGGVRVISIINFTKHQTPHGTEKDSELPDENGALTTHDRTGNGYVTGSKRKNNVNSTPNNGGQPLDNSADAVDPSGQNALNPDSLNPDSLNSPSLRSGESAIAPQPPTPKPEKPSKPKTLATYLDECKAAKTKPIPDGHSLRTWAQEAGITAEMLQIAWMQFRERYTEAEKGKGKRYKDWPAHFATAIKGNWFKLWFAGDGGMQWSSIGLTHKTVLDARMAQREAEHA